ncbi:MAG: DoxX family protein [Mycobacteriaceae bacterium]|nr:DoxX family protein [Mycobacteriaceae bacterium]
MTPQDPWQRPDDSASPPLRSGAARLVDPEDDFPSENYGGDFTTTAIPRYDSAGPASGPASGAPYGLIGEPEPLPYVQPGPTGRHAVVGPEEVEPDDLDGRVRAARKRGTQDLGLMLLRVGVGAVLIVHGLQKAFGLWGGQGLDGFRNSLGDLGYKHADVLTYAAAGTQLATGVLLVLGLFTPMAGAVAVAYLTNGLLATIVSQHTGGQLFVRGSIEYQAMLVLAVAAIILAGPGLYGFDAGRGWARRPFLGSVLALLVGIGGGIGAWVLLNGANPLG